MSRVFRAFSGQWAFLGLFGVFMMASCSQTKDTFINRTFHNLSGHYNGYYNAGVKLLEGTDRLAEQHEDHYDRTLRVYRYANAEKAKSVYPQMDDVIKRTGTVISRHTIYDKNGNEKPNSEHWIDDNWLLYGKALFFKHEYFAAMEAFNYVEVTYKKETTRHLASLWIAKTYLELTQLNEAENKLDYVRNQSDFPKKNRWELEATFADYYVQVRNNSKAIEHLTRAAELAPRRDDRIRFLFILGQLQQAEEKFSLAFDTYSRVIKMNPPYEMGFNARINRARCYEAGGKGSDEVRNELAKLQKDPKNKDFLDQIYYALAGLEKKSGNEPGEIEYLNKSVQASTTNKNQKALSYLELAKIAFVKPDYRLAKGYYDSTIANLSNDHPDYTEVLQRRNSLTRLVRYLNIIQNEDSLQSLAQMTPEQRAKLVDDQIRKEEEEKARQKEEEQSNQIFQPGNNPQQANQFNKEGGSNWYFYNQQATAFGFNEFTRRWGNRKLEDNWRRSSREQVFQATEEKEDTLVTEAKEIADPKAAAEAKKKAMLDAIPATPEAIEKSTNKIIDAYYNAAMIYREQLKDNSSAAEMFEELLRRFPENKFKLQSMYQLYRLYAQLGNPTKSEYYKNIILNQYGDTEYAEIIRNPNYGQDMATRKSQLELFYEETYRKYLNGEYTAVIQRRSQAETMFPQNAFMPKFDLLKAMSIGKTQTRNNFEASLQDVVRTWADDPVREAAQDMLDYLQQQGGGAAPAADTARSTPVEQPAATARNYNYFPDTTHYVIVVFQAIGGALDANRFKTKLSNFNTANFGSKGLQTQDLMLDHRMKLVVIKNFANKAEAMAYFSALYDNDEVYGVVDVSGYQQYAVSINNFPEIIRQKKLDEYEDFFRSFYR